MNRLLLHKNQIGYCEFRLNKRYVQQLPPLTTNKVVAIASIPNTHIKQGGGEESKNLFVFSYLVLAT